MARAFLCDVSLHILHKILRKTEIDPLFLSVSLLAVLILYFIVKIVIWWMKFPRVYVLDQLSPQNLNLSQFSQTREEKARINFF